MERVQDMIHKNHYRQAAKALMGMISGIDHDGSEYETETHRRDGILLAAANDLHAARLCPKAEDRQHFAECALLRLRSINGGAEAEYELSAKIEAGAITAEIELDGFGG
jgi:hypothetical protein